MIHVRRWWPVPVLLAASLVVQTAFFESRYDVSGHAAEHLSSASVAFFAFALVAILLYVTPLARRQPLVLVTSAMWLFSTVLVLVGNVRVVDALVGAGMSDTPTSQLIVDDTLDSAHDLANLAPWLGVLTAIALTGALWRYRHVSGRVAVGSAVLSLISRRGSSLEQECSCLRSRVASRTSACPQPIEPLPQAPPFRPTPNAGTMTP